MEMDRRTFLTTMMGAAAAVALGGCQGDEGDRGSRATPGPGPRPTLRLPGGDYGFPSPFAYFVGPGYLRASYIYDALLLNDASGDLLPWVASRYERSPDGLRYTFEVRDNAKWHDGQALTADDVVFTYEYFLAKDLQLPPFVIGRPQDVEQVQKAGECSVEIVLKQPTVTFASAQAGFVPIVPKHVWSGIADPGKAQDPAVLVGSGPYRLESYNRGEGSYLYVANDEFFLGRPFVKRLEMRSVGDELVALLAGELDAGGPRATGAKPEALAPFRADPNFGVIEGPLDLTVALYWNGSRGGALADPRFRRACAAAIDRADLTRRMVGPNGEPGNPGFLPRTHPFHVEVEQHPFNRTAANRMMDEAGYVRSSPGGVRQGTDGKPLRFAVLLNEEVTPVAELVMAALREIGVELTVQPVQGAQIFAAMTFGNYDMAVVLYGNLSGDPNYMRTLYSSKTQKFFHSARGYVNAELDELAERQRLTFDQAARRQLVARMQHIVAHDLPFLHLYYPTPFLIFRKPVFDQWSYSRAGGFLSTPYNKQTFVTGSKTGGLHVRPSP